MDWIYYLTMTGVFAFGISGVLTAIDNDFDIIGSAIIGFITALGGGTLRDLLIGETPVGWMKDINYLWAILASIVVSYLFKNRIQKLRKSRFVFDSVGLGLFTILGVQKTLDLGLNPIIALLMGVVSAVFGGVLRDVLSNVVPLIFRSEIYASACLIGGGVFIGLSSFSNILYVNMLVAMSTVFIIRYFAVKKKWTLKF
ncbi:MAG: hypothetical protein COA58_06520 [Bacteroidetes bacterium]|nr:MAG: hypothetical protein COA58_06520 [Bacteroidota bacterium]